MILFFFQVHPNYQTLKYHSWDVFVKVVFVWNFMFFAIIVNCRLKAHCLRQLRKRQPSSEDWKGDFDCVGTRYFKGTCYLGSVELVHEKPLKQFVMKSIWLERCFKSRLLMISTNMPRNGMVFLLLCKLTIGHFMQSKTWLHKISNKDKPSLLKSVFNIFCDFLILVRRNHP